MRTPYRGQRSLRGAGLILTLLCLSTQARAEILDVTIENLAPINGNFLTPVWVALHDGSFDIYDQGVAASAALEAIAEDGNTAPISAAFTASGAGTVQGTIVGPSGPIAPGDVATMRFQVDPSSPSSRYFSFATMIIPSNDAFVANGDPTSLAVFDGLGNFVGVDIFIAGSQVLDAGTEVNDELPMNTAFFGQMMPNTGTDENGVVSLHPGFLPAGSGGILDDPMFANADFTRSNYPVAQIRVTLIPVPPAAILLLSALIGLMSWGRRARARLQA